jgi:hypothetical protein
MQHFPAKENKKGHGGHTCVVCLLCGLFFIFICGNLIEYRMHARHTLIRAARMQSQETAEQHTSAYVSIRQHALHVCSHKRPPSCCDFTAGRGMLYI